MIKSKYYKCNDDLMKTLCHSVYNYYKDISILFKIVYVDNDDFENCENIYLYNYNKCTWISHSKEKCIFSIPLTCITEKDLIEITKKQANIEIKKRKVKINKCKMMKELMK